MSLLGLVVSGSENNFVFSKLQQISFLFLSQTVKPLLSIIRSIEKLFNAFYLDNTKVLSMHRSYFIGFLRGNFSFVEKVSKFNICDALAAKPDKETQVAFLIKRYGKMS